MTHKDEGAREICSGDASRYCREMTKDEIRKLELYKRAIEYLLNN